jgi:orotate phosphoribosyltransferase
MIASGDLYYRSFDDLNRLVRESAQKLPTDIDVVIGVPRSGLLVANLIALHLHVPLAELNGFARGELLYHGWRIAQRGELPAFRKALVVDDSVTSGAELRNAQEKLKHLRCQLLYAVAYATPESLHMVDYAFEVVPQPRVFEWNIMNGEVLGNACVDIDGVLCRDPSDDENDDGERYLQFLSGVPVRCRPKTRIKHLVTSRLERYRRETEEWLGRSGIQYEKLWMAPYATGAERRAAQAYGKLKADVYRETGALLFIESSEKVAREIAELVQKPVFCTDARQMMYPGRAPGSVMTFPGRTPPGVQVPLGWFVRQAGTEAASRLVNRFWGMLPRARL